MRRRPRHGAAVFASGRFDAAAAPCRSDASRDRGVSARGGHFVIAALSRSRLAPLLQSGTRRRPRHGAAVFASGRFDAAAAPCRSDASRDRGVSARGGHFVIAALSRSRLAPLLQSGTRRRPRHGAAVFVSGRRDVATAPCRSDASRDCGVSARDGAFVVAALSRSRLAPLPQSGTRRRPRQEAAVFVSARRDHGAAQLTPESSAPPTAPAMSATPATRDGIARPGSPRESLPAPLAPRCRRTRRGR